MRSRKLALLFVPVMLLAALPGVATASGPSAQAESRAEVLKYWTPAKMKSAKWLDVHYDKTEKVGHLVTRSQAGRRTPATAPARPTTGRPTTITKGTGRVLLRLRSAARYICSGSVVTDEAQANYSIVLTAAHCVFDQKTGQFATQWMFIPAFDITPTYTCAATTYGCWNATARSPRRSRVHERAASDEHRPARRLGVRRRSAAAASGTPAQLDADRRAAVVQPRSRDISRVKGHDPDGHRLPGGGAVRRQRPDVLPEPRHTAITKRGNPTYRMACNMTGGSSGGPWVTPFEDGDRVSTGRPAFAQLVRLLGRQEHVRPDLQRRTTRRPSATRVQTPATPHVGQLRP